MIFNFCLDTLLECKDLSTSVTEYFIFLIKSTFQNQNINKSIVEADKIENLMKRRKQALKQLIHLSKKVTFCIEFNLNETDNGLDVVDNKNVDAAAIFSYIVDSNSSFGNSPGTFIIFKFIN